MCIRDRNGGCTRSVQFPDLSALYGYLPEQRLCVLPHKVAPDSPLCIGSKVLERKVSREEERYSRVYLDILGLIAVGRYRPGQRLPSHAQLCQTYGVSVDTTIKAVRLLQELSLIHIWMRTSSSIPTARSRPAWPAGNICSSCFPPDRGR